MFKRGQQIKKTRSEQSGENAEMTLFFAAGAFRCLEGVDFGL